MNAGRSIFFLWGSFPLLLWDRQVGGELQSKVGKSAKAARRFLGGGDRSR